MWPHTLFIVVALYIEFSYWTSKSGFGATAQPSLSREQWTKERKLEYREATRRLWHHGFDSYMDHAFPMDELMPKACRGRGPDYANPANIGHNDVMANFSLTLVDNLDTFIALNNYSGFEWAVKQTIDYVSFDQDTKPQVFEITIRGMGGLLSAHMFASDKEGRWGFGIPWYNDELLSLAYDLGRRLLPAFRTNTGIPFARINLRHGLPKTETYETCTAGAGSLLLEWTTLSRLSGDPEFERVARKAFFAIWNRRSDLGLLPNTINLANGYSRGSDGFWYRNVGANTGDLATVYIDSLSAFWPGLQVLAGDVQSAIKSHLVYWNLWRRYSGIPETFNIATRQGVTLGYPLRPEFIESTYFLYRATQDPFYLDVGERVLLDLIRRAKVDCGLSTLSNVQTGEHEDRMESFALSETLKYLFLMFDEDNKINSDDQNVVFTTEGHLITISQQYLKKPSEASRYYRQKEQNFCPVYQPTRNPPDTYAGEAFGLVQSIRSRPDSDYGRFITGLDLSVVGASDSPWWDLSGRCAVPQPEEYLTIGDSDEGISLFATTALFGADPSSERSPGTFRIDAPALHVVPSTPENLDGCGDHEAQPILKGAVLVVKRGVCTFMEKLARAKKAGAAGAIVISDTDGMINPSIDREEEDYAALELTDVALVALTQRGGTKLLKALETSLDVAAPLWVEVSRQPSLEDEIAKEEEEEKPRLLYINGKALLNTVIMI
ncbi:alpha mannosidase-like protein [Ceratobasidium sp. 423]|nr:alpha mannosidase-like protein [Ceratobasidium sp. 423]